jgi:SET domain-containing protein
MIDKKFLKVKRSTAGAGLGLFTMVPIPKGEQVIEYTGERINDEEYDRRNSKYIFEIDKDKNIDGAARSNTARYINHSCRPNCEAEIDGDRIFILAKRSIMLGEELAYDYGKLYWNTFIKEHGCRCVKCTAEKKSGVKAVKKAKKGK